MSSPVRIRRSVFDRLLDNNPDMPEGLMQTCTVEQLRDAVARDLESLLNSRAAINFDADRRHISRSLSHAIETHEPRLQAVSVQFHDEQTSQSSLAFTIRAMLVVRPTRETVSFDAVLQPSLSSYRVMQARFASA